MNKLKQIRKTRHMTQLQLSVQSGVPQATISAIETGDRPNPRIQTAIALASALSCSVYDLFPLDSSADEEEGTI